MGDKEHQRLCSTALRTKWPRQMNHARHDISVSPLHRRCTATLCTYHVLANTCWCLPMQCDKALEMQAQHESLHAFNIHLPLQQADHHVMWVQ